jgi:hypothetical protein
MKNALKKYASLMLLPGMLLVNACDDFGDVNVNPNAIQTSTPEYILSKSLYDGTQPLGNHPGLLLGNMQYTTSWNDIAGFGSKYTTAQQTRTAGPFSDSYTNQINEINEVIKVMLDKPEEVNKLSIARIWRVYCYHRLTDLYGDIPYTEGGQGYIQGIYQPKYTPQADIYADMLKELQEATAAFNSDGATFGTGDVIYGGNTDQWKKFGYSLMLRLGMRLTEVEESEARTWVERAIAGGVILNDGEIASVKNYNATGQTLTRNPMAYRLLDDDYRAANGFGNKEGGKYQQTFIDSLKANNDPRLPVLAVVWVGGSPDNDPAIQKGMSDREPGQAPTDFASLSEPNPATVLKEDGALLLFTVSESSYLLAEAALRGWYTGQTAASLFETGIRAAMRQWQIAVGTAGAIDPVAIDAYVAAHPLVATTPANIEPALAQIYTQFWMGSFPEAQEPYNHYRRLGYPALTPNDYPGNATGNKLIRRFLYPNNEQTLNPTSYQEALQRQANELGWDGDDLNGHVWWDVNGR